MHRLAASEGSSLRSRTARLVVAALVLGACTRVDAQDLVFKGLDFESWNHPRGLVKVLPGGVEVKRFGKGFNAVANAGEFSSSVIGISGLRPEHAASNQSQAHRVTDQDPATWWQPDPADPLQTWWVEIDLGRAVVATQIRFIFPDTTGARPFTFFSVFTSPGIPVFGGKVRRVDFSRVGRPVNNNTNRVVEFDLETSGLNPAAGENLVNTETLDFDIIRFVRFVAEGRSSEAALAEIEVDGVGFNLSTRIATQRRVENGESHWGGRTWTSKARDCDGCGKGSGAEVLVDQDLGVRWWAIQSQTAGDWRDRGIWGVIDFGSTFRIDRMVWLPIVYRISPILYGFERWKQCSWEVFDFLTSDGTPSNRADPVVEGLFEYEYLSQVDNDSWPLFRHLFDFQFPPRDVRLVLWRK